MAAVLRPGPHGGSPASPPGSPVAHQQSIRRLQSVAARARVSTAAAATEVVGRPSDLRRADRLLAGGGKIFEDVPLDSDDDDDEEPPRVTELGGSWVFGRRVSDEASSAEKRLATLIVVALLFALGYWLAAQLGPPLPPPGDGAPHAAAPGGVDPAAVLSKLRYAVRKRIFDARPEQAGDSDSLPEVDDSESWSADDDESMWLRTERQGGAARQVASTQDELFTLFFMATAVSSLFFFVFDFVSSSFT